ncbi:hypothetical protein AVEN_195831-1 [Araneus ventricosus]|uniref:Uncharacterized protein n=1 Tax=Araneus ventricosus TaxID=182803 RepID=A0A4Y2F5G6_ARAVE|nr:hypothetical protein AVEN_195831-1 [Araneus ventricosus]
MANPKNKDRLISILMNKFSSVNMIYKKADEDADCLIVKTIALAPTYPSVVVIVLEKTIADDILLIHAMSGCDNTSALFNYVKLKFVQTLKNNNDLLKVIEIFKNPDMTPEAAMEPLSCGIVWLPNNYLGYSILD